MISSNANIGRFESGGDLYEKEINDMHCSYMFHHIALSDTIQTERWWNSEISGLVI